MTSTRRLETNRFIIKDINTAAQAWGTNIQESLDVRFGKDRVGFMLVLATTGEGGTMTLKTSFKLSQAVAFLRELASKVEAGKSENTELQ